jgi:hypothetical protein
MGKSGKTGESGKTGGSSKTGGLSSELGRAMRRGVGCVGVPSANVACEVGGACVLEVCPLRRWPKKSLTPVSSGAPCE